MDTRIKAWIVGADHTPQRLPDATPQLEAHLETWIDRVPDALDDDFLPIGRQVQTRWGTYIDLLGIDSKGDLVVCELKRGRTPRETVAQAIEYAAWSSTLSYDAVTELAAVRYGSRELFAEAFRGRFGQELPKTLNPHFSPYVVTGCPLWSTSG
jgi:hypothetical protein